MRHAHAVLAGALAAAAAVGCRPPGDSTLRVGERDRTYELFVPLDKPGMPLVIALHGRAGTGPQMERFSRFDQVAAAEQFVVAYPDGIDHGWSDGRAEITTGRDDVAFIASLIERLAQDEQIDRRRVYVTGASNGGMMTYRIGCELADRVAAIAPVIANLPANIHCRPSVPISVLAINGTEDPVVPYNGGQIWRNRGEVLSAALSVETFARRAGCGVPVTTTEPDVDLTDGSRTHATSFQCPAPHAIELLTLDGAGHTWPSGAQYLPRRLIGGTSRDFDGAERIWEFFANHSR